MTLLMSRLGGYTSAPLKVHTAYTKLRPDCKMLEKYIFIYESDRIETNEGPHGGRNRLHRNNWAKPVGKIAIFFQ